MATGRGSRQASQDADRIRPGGKLIPLLLAVNAALATPLDVAPEDLVRVDVPDYPGAIGTSDEGSLLLSPPDDVPWRPEPVGVPDSFDAWEAVEAMDVQPWRDAGSDGSGVKIAVFDYLYFGAGLEEDEIGEVTTHDCITQRSCDLPFDPEYPQFLWEQGSHGLACAEVIHDLAPGAELHLVRVNGLTSLENATAWAAREGIDVVSMSLSFFGESFYDGTGPISAAAERVADAGGVFVTSAGNYAEEHLDDRYRDDDGDGWTDWPGGSDYLPVSLSPGTATVLLAWDEFDACGTTDLDLYIVDKNGAVVGRSDDAQVSSEDGGKTCAPTERASVTAGYEGWYWVRVARVAGDGEPRMSLFTRGGDLYAPTPEASIVDPGASPSVFTVGAVRATADYLGGDPESFSSWGPTEGGLAKPDVAGPDGLSGSVYGPSGFYGTSAATPAVAAAIALVLGDDPTLTPQQAAERVRATAWLEDPVWSEPDPGLGAGRVRLPPPETWPSEADGCGRRGIFLPGLLWFLTMRARRQEARCDCRP